MFSVYVHTWDVKNDSPLVCRLRGQGYVSGDWVMEAGMCSLRCDLVQGSSHSPTQRSRESEHGPLG